MPITIAVNADERVRYTVFSGDVTDAELLDAYRCALAESGYDPSLPGFIDLRDAGRLEITPSAVWELSNMLRRADPAGTQRRAAFVAPTDFLFGMARMFAALGRHAIRNGVPRPRLLVVRRVGARRRPVQLLS